MSMKLAVREIISWSVGRTICYSVAYQVRFTLASVGVRIVRSAPHVEFILPQLRSSNMSDVT